MSTLIEQVAEALRGERVESDRSCLPDCTIGSEDAVDLAKIAIRVILQSEEIMGLVEAATLADEKLGIYYKQTNGEYTGGAENQWLRNSLHKHLTALSMQPVSGWRPIESAPKDGADFLMYDASCKRYSVVCIKEERWIKPDNTRGVDYGLYPGGADFSSSKYWKPLDLPPMDEVRDE